MPIHERIRRQVRIVPFSGLYEYDLQDYIKRLRDARAHEVVSLDNEPSSHKGEVERAGIPMHVIDVMGPTIGQKVSPDEIRKYAEAVRLARERIEGGKNIALTCKMGRSRSPTLLYLLSRQMGATHEEALKHSNPPSYLHPDLDGVHRRIQRLQK
jgi:hypothetical protein